MHFPSTEVLEACGASEGGKQTIAHAFSICSGGAPTILLAKEETVGAGERQRSPLAVVRQLVAH